MLAAGVADAGPRSVTGVVRHGLRLWADNAVTLWVVLVPLTLAAELVVVLATVAAAPAGSTVLNGTIYVLPGSATGAIKAARLFGEVVGGLVGVLGAGVGLRIFSQAALGHTERPAAALRFSWQRFGSLLWLAIIAAVATVAGLFALIIPGIYLFVAFAVGAPVVVIEGHRGVVALRRSHTLVKRRWWATLGALLPTMILVGAGGFLVITTLRTSGSVSGYALTQAVGIVVLQSLLVPLSTATTVAIYFDLHARGEPGRRIEASRPQVDLATPPPTPPSTGDIWWS